MHTQARTWEKAPWWATASGAASTRGASIPRAEWWTFPTRTSPFRRRAARACGSTASSSARWSSCGSTRRAGPRCGRWRTDPTCTTVRCGCEKQIVRRSCVLARMHFRAIHVHASPPLVCLHFSLFHSLSPLLPIPRLMVPLRHGAAKGVQHVSGRDGLEFGRLFSFFLRTYGTVAFAYAPGCGFIPCAFRFLFSVMREGAGGGNDRMFNTQVQSGG